VTGDDDRDDDRDDDSDDDSDDKVQCARAVALWCRSTVKRVP
jgi:hypothetical protein